MQLGQLLEPKEKKKRPGRFAVRNPRNSTTDQCGQAAFNSIVRLSRTKSIKHPPCQLFDWIVSPFCQEKTNASNVQIASEKQISQKKGQPDRKFARNPQKLTLISQSGCPFQHGIVRLFLRTITTPKEQHSCQFAPDLEKGQIQTVTGKNGTPQLTRRAE